MRPWLLPILAGALIALAAAADPPLNELPDVSAAAPGRPATPPRVAPAEPEKRVPLESSAGFEPRAAHGEY